MSRTFRSRRRPAPRPSRQADIIAFHELTYVCPTQCQAAERLLILLGALDKFTKNITPVGRAMAKSDIVMLLASLAHACRRFPISPRYAKMLSLAQHYDVLAYVASIVAALSVRVRHMSHVTCTASYAGRCRACLTLMKSSQWRKRKMTQQPKRPKTQPSQPQKWCGTSGRLRALLYVHDEICGT